MIEFFASNYDWIFSGIGSGLLLYFLGRRHGCKKAIAQRMSTGENSLGLQIAGDMKGDVIDKQ